MSASAARDYDVVISGLGPIGAYLAVLLGQAGHKVLAVERDREVYPLPRAVHVDHEVVRLLGLAGADEALLSVSRPTATYEFRTAHGDLLMGFRPPETPSVTGYPWSNLFFQPALEHALRDRLAKLETVELLLGCSFSGYTEKGDRLSVALEQDGAASQVSARYLVGCDGARSAVRRAADIGLDDLDFNEPWAVVDVILPDPAGALEDVSRQICDPARPVTSIPIGRGRHRWEFMLLPGETADALLAPETLMPLIEAQLPAGMTPADITIERSAVYTFHGVFAKTWRKGRVLLAGDAAHQMPPFMGQGLCSGIRDAANVAWKLDAVLGGRSSDALLDTVQPEREPQVRFITETAIGMGRVVCTQDRDAAMARDTDMLAAPEADRWNELGDLPPIAAGVGPGAGAGVCFARDADLDDASVLAPILVLGGDTDARAAAEWQARVPGLVVARASRGRKADAGPGPVVAGAVAAQLGDAPALLARPDRVVFGTGEPAALVDAYAAYASGAGRAAA